MSKYNKLFQGALGNIIESAIQEGIKTNAELSSKAGFQPMIVRSTDGNCCDWCTEKAGIYKYPCDTDVYRRHDNCSCTIEYVDYKGIQNVYTKVSRTPTESEQSVYESYNKVLSGKLSSNNFLNRYAHNKAVELGYNPIPIGKVVEESRKLEEEWYKLLTEEERRSIKKYSYNTKDGINDRLYEKINNYLMGRYEMLSNDEIEIIIRNASNIIDAILKNELTRDMVVYRYDEAPKSLNGVVNKFLSTSVVSSKVHTKLPNVAIIVPKGTECAYIERVSEFPKQREMLLNYQTKLEKVARFDELYVYKVIT